MKVSNGRVFLILALLGTVAPLAAFVPFLVTNGLAPGLFLTQLFQTPVSRFFALDLLVSAITFLVFVSREGRRIRMRYLWIFLACTLVVGVSLGLPLFLFFRERKLG